MYMYVLLTNLNLRTVTFNYRFYLTVFYFHYKATPYICSEKLQKRSRNTVQVFLEEFFRIRILKEFISRKESFFGSVAS